MDLASSRRGANERLLDELRGYSFFIMFKKLLGLVPRFGAGA
jgi:hypothetical protein